MSKVLNIVFLIIVVFAGFMYRERLGTIWTQTLINYFPCRVPIKYSIGEFDDRFGLTRQEFLNTIARAEKVWEDEANRNLFEYKEGGDLQINLIYDVRQESTVQLQSIEDIVESNREDYESLRKTYEAIVAQYERDKSALELRIAKYSSRQDAYQKEVTYWNRRGGAGEDVYNRLNAEKEYLNREYDLIGQEEERLNDTIDEINVLVESLNQLARTLNIGVSHYNNIGKMLDVEFDEGVYRSGPDGHEIDIYQFENETKLFRVLAHELGHALGLDHIEDSKAIMYRLNNGINENLTENDILILKQQCKISE